MSQFKRPVATPRDEAVWLQPFPDALLEGAADVPPGPEARSEQAEAISLAFVTAMQVLPTRQVADLILRDVLGFHASEVAGMLEVTVQSVNFFFQAEDGIRDLTVTGVQTCALPI